MKMFDLLERALSCFVLITQKQAHLTETPTLKKRDPCSTIRPIFTNMGAWSTNVPNDIKHETQCFM